jgi:hypothetical protein
MSAVSQTLGTAQLLRKALGTARASAARVDHGQPGTWKVELTMSGLPDERRLELARALNVAVGVEMPDEWPSTGLLTCNAVSGKGFSLAVAATQAISTLYSLLQQVGLTPEEVTASEVVLTMEPLDEPGAREAAHTSLLGRMSYGLGVASADAFDMGAKQRNGEMSFEVLGLIQGCPDDTRVILAQADGMRAQVERPGRVTDGSLALTATCDRVGSGLGALLLASRSLAPVLEQAPGTARLHMRALPAS